MLATCQPHEAASPATSSPRPQASSADVAPTPSGMERYAWAAETGSPGAPGAASVAALGPGVRCGYFEARLEHVAQRLAQRQARGLRLLDMPEIEFALRTEGAPYVWPRAWTAELGTATSEEEFIAHAEHWLASFADGGKRRCGAYRTPRSAGEPGEIVAVVVSDVLADLVRPLPVRTRVGQWLTLEAEMLVPTTEAKVLLLGPRGAPQPIPTSLAGSRVKASFATDLPGPWLVHLLATVPTGPRPVIEASIHAAVDPPMHYRALQAPGEYAAEPGQKDEEALTAMINAARQSEGLQALSRDPRLDGLAQAHARAMHDAARLGHDIGTGTLEMRLAAADLEARVGENVAHTADILQAHRGLWASPSHRGNLLGEFFEAVGIGVVQDADGSVWVCETFADWPE